MAKEEWRLVPFAPAYEVSSLGRVRCAARGVSTSPGRVLKPWTEKNGYLRVTLRIGGRSVKHWLHRIVLIAFEGEPPTSEHEAAHGDGVKANNRRGNLRWATPKENAEDAARHGTALFGERANGAKLTAIQVVEIRSKYSGEWGEQTRIARQYGITPSVISEIVNGKKWKERPHA